MTDGPDCESATLDSQLCHVRPRAAVGASGCAHNRRYVRKAHLVKLRPGSLPWSSSPGGAKKGINKEYKDLFQNCSVTIRALKLRFWAFSEGPGGFREVREAGRNHFHLSWYLSNRET